MTDIVERLRWIAVNLNGMPDGDAVTHAAKEIERLRVKLEAATDAIHEWRMVAMQHRDALQYLLYMQKGPPLDGRFADEWQAAVDKARAALGEEE